MKTESITPYPTMEGWIANLSISGKAKNALIDLIAGVRNENINRAKCAEVQLQIVTKNWSDLPPTLTDLAVIASGIKEAIRDFNGILSAFDGEDMCDVPTVAQYRIGALMSLLAKLEKS